MLFIHVIIQKLGHILKSITGEQLYLQLRDYTINHNENKDENQKKIT